MKNKHTPGPWGLIKWRDEPGWRLTPPDGRCVCFGVLPDEDDEDNANARLIAAAPELLAALKDAERAIIDGIEAQTGREYRERDAIPALHKVRTAIAKAEGR